MTIFWFRRDLRLEDNIGLYEALEADNNVLPIFIFDINILDELPKDDARVTFICHLLHKIQVQLNKFNKSLATFYGDPITIFKQLLNENKIKAVYANRDYEPYARYRDKEVHQLLASNNIDFKTFKDVVIYEKDEIAKDDGSPYVVFTPYMKKWLTELKTKDIEISPSETQPSNFTAHSYPFLTLADIGFIASDIEPVPFDISADLIDNYEDTRNFPSLDGTSKLGPYLRFGAVSIRLLVKKAVEARNATFLNELVWREFFMQILWHFPHTTHKSFRSKYDNIKWRNNEEEFKSWCEGRTGYPIVDAGMRQLNATGFMHNRVRMVVASFLCKHLLIDWRWGEAYFALKLLDYEQASNVGNWQWAAGSGVDAAPYFRIFNPAEQVKKFDKELLYIRKWVPEFENLDYLPIVDHKEARERALQVYKDAVQ